VTTRQNNDVRLVDVRFERSPIPVAVTTTVIVPPTLMRGYDEAIIFLDNDGADTLNAQVEVSPNGVFPGYVIPDDAFASMAPGSSRWTRVSASGQWFRVTGLFSVSPGSVRRTSVLQRGVTGAFRP
jgi:hypothetical protein